MRFYVGLMLRKIDYLPKATVMPCHDNTYYQPFDQQN
jgi:hypothetical protein